MSELLKDYDKYVALIGWGDNREVSSYFEKLKPQIVALVEEQKTKLEELKTHSVDSEEYMMLLNENKTLKKKLCSLCFMGKPCMYKEDWQQGVCSFNGPHLSKNALRGASTEEKQK